MTSSGWDIGDLISAIASAHIDREDAAIERDLLSIPGVTEDILLEDAAALDLTIIRQLEDESSMFPIYRGIAQHGKMIIDHRPDLGPIHLEAGE